MLVWILVCDVQVASRRVIQTGAVFLILLGLLGKFGALLVTIPNPVVGGVFLVMFGKISFLFYSFILFL
jgi:nucleobase transporter 1/2